MKYLWFKMCFSISSFLFRYFRLFSISLRYETVLLGVDPYFLLCLDVEPLKPPGRLLSYCRIAIYHQLLIFFLILSFLSPIKTSSVSVTLTC